MVADICNACVPVCNQTQCVQATLPRRTTFCPSQLEDLEDAASAPFNGFLKEYNAIFKLSNAKDGYNIVDTSS
jgi:hypothetical protein